MCWADRLGRPATPLWRTADWGYVRMHEGMASPRPAYGRTALATWLDRMDAAWPLRSAAADVFVFFNNDRGGAAIHNARTLCRMARAPGAGGGAADARLASPGCRPPPTAPASPFCPPACALFSPMRSRPAGGCCRIPTTPSPSCGPRRPPPTAGPRARRPCRPALGAAAVGGGRALRRRDPGARRPHVDLRQGCLRRAGGRARAGAGAGRAAGPRALRPGHVVDRAAGPQPPRRPRHDRGRRRHRRVVAAAARALRV